MASFYYISENKYDHVQSQPIQDYCHDFLFENLGTVVKWFV